MKYEESEPWPLEWVESAAERLSYAVVEKMQLSKDKDSLWVNSSLTLARIPPEAFAFRLGNRSPLDWLIDQFQVSENERRIRRLVDQLSVTPI